MIWSITRFRNRVSSYRTTVNIFNMLSCMYLRFITAEGLAESQALCNHSFTVNECRYLKRQNMKIIHHVWTESYQVLHEARIPSRCRSDQSQILLQTTSQCWCGEEYAFLLPSPVRGKLWKVAQTSVSSLLHKTISLGSAIKSHYCQYRTSIAQLSLHWTPWSDLTIAQWVDKIRIIITAVEWTVSSA